MALRPVRRADSPFQEAHGRQAVPVRRVLPLFLPLGPPGLAHEEAPELVTRHSPSGAPTPNVHYHVLTEKIKWKATLRPPVAVFGTAPLIHFNIYTEQLNSISKDFFFYYHKLLIGTTILNVIERCRNIQKSFMHFAGFEFFFLKTTALTAAQHCKTEVTSADQIRWPRDMMRSHFKLHN